MIVTFISQCEKKALKRTRRVLDAFANRIGDNSWQTIITEEGLKAVRKLLQKTASKSTAVSCHWIRSRSRSDLIWLVGNKNKFNYEGLVPVNSSSKKTTNNPWESSWYYLPIIRVVTALAALLHDWGKASVYFQKKLSRNTREADPLRHEWISCLLFHAFVLQSDENTDENWLKRLANGNIDEKKLINKVKKNSVEEFPIKNLPPLATTIAWLILTHHRLPVKKDVRGYKECNLEDYKDLLHKINSSFGYSNELNQDESKNCLTFKEGLLEQSTTWKKEVKKWARKALKQLELMEEVFKNDIWRIILFYSRLSLMLGDHNYSSKKACQKWKSEIKLYANTKKNKLDQKLDEHLVGVAGKALNVANSLRVFEKDKFPIAFVESLKTKSPKEFSWQDKAVEKIKEWNKIVNSRNTHESQAFFAVNMASTGKGKTFANAKIMQALSKDENSLRYILALGLRVLTLQTGKEYKKRLKVSDEDLAVLIGGTKAFQNLHDAGELSIEEKSGSESQEELCLEEVYYEGDSGNDDLLSTVIKKDKDKKLLYPPILVCTIDHIMGATEAIRGGRYILPSLRLMSSDLIIDEVDDFDIDDLKAIGRLIHLSGMLGRKVMISSATISPSLAKGFFHAYEKGWKIFAKSRKMDIKIGCAWIDEFKTHVESV